MTRCLAAPEEGPDRDNHDGNGDEEPGDHSGRAVGWRRDRAVDDERDRDDDGDEDDRRNQRGLRAARDRRLVLRFCRGRSAAITDERLVGDLDSAVATDHDSSKLASWWILELATCSFIQ